MNFKVSNLFEKISGRRNPLKSRSKSSETNTEESKESRSAETTVQDKPKSQFHLNHIYAKFSHRTYLFLFFLYYIDRFSRPSFSARSRPTPTVAAVTNSEEEEIVKQKAKPLAAATASRGRSNYIHY